MTIKNFWTKFLGSLIKVFSGRNLLWHVLAVILTYLIMISGFDWIYFRFFFGTIIYKVLLSAGIIGAFLPILAPLVLYIVGKLKKQAATVDIALALAQAALLGSFVSSFYKSFTGRAYPVSLGGVPVDATRVFNFSWFQSGIFWGWPSSHTMIAFAMSFALIAMYPKNGKVKFWAILYALFIGIGVSMSYHWFSDFVAGAIIGTVIGIAVGKSFITNHLTNAT